MFGDYLLVNFLHLAVQVDAIHLLTLNSLDLTAQNSKSLYSCTRLMQGRRRRRRYRQQRRRPFVGRALARCCCALVDPSAILDAELIQPLSFLLFG